MKKKFRKRLTINKETLANLNRDDQLQIKGGWMTYTCPDPDFGCDTNYRCTTGCPSVIVIYCRG